tara:strand:+ start:4425 stop:4817 length:393 start_codon:yes stop_codon:yes gene_type:complete
MKIYDTSDNLLAIVIRCDDIRKGKNFVTNNDNEFQLAGFSLDKGENIERHFHPDQERIIRHTSEVLVLIEGEMEIEIYDNNQNLIDEIKVLKHDTVGFFGGGHGIKLSTNCKFIEVKQGPFDEKTDKKRF